MSKQVVLVKVGEKDGLDIYSAIDSASEKLMGGADVIAANILGARATRTALQNSAIHKYFDLLCEALNSAGWDMKATMEKLSKNAMIPWSPSAIKERLWRPVQIDTYGIESSTKLDTDQVSGVYEALNLVTSEKLGVSVPFPDRYSQLDKLQR